MLDDVGIVDVTSANQPEELGKDEPVLTDGKRQRIALARIRVGHHHVVAAAGAMHEELAGGVREIGAVDLAPGLAIVSGEGAKQKLRPSVVANEADDGFAIGEDVPVRLLGAAVAVVRGERVDAPVIKGLRSADHDGDLSLVIATGHHPLARRKTLRGKVVHGVVKDRAVGHPFRAVPAKGFQAQSRTVVSRRVEMAGESEEFAVAFPQTAGDPTDSL